MSLQDVMRRKALFFSTSPENLRRLAMLSAIAQEVADQEWIADWKKGKWSDDPRFASDFTGFYEKLGPVLQRLVHRFPPACIVRAREGADLAVPSSSLGARGLVLSYGEPNDFSPEGYCNVLHSPVAQHIGRCRPSDLVLVDFRRGFDHEAIRSLVGDAP